MPGEAEFDLRRNPIIIVVQKAPKEIESLRKRNDFVMETFHGQRNVVREINYICGEFRSVLGID